MMLEERKDVVIISGSKEEIKKLKESPNLKRGDEVCIMKEDLPQIVPEIPEKAGTSVTKVFKADVPQDAFYKEKISSQAREIQSLTEELDACHKKIASLEQDILDKKIRMHKLEAALIDAAIK